YPVAAVRDDDGGDVGADQLHLFRQRGAVRLLAADRKNREGQLRAGELRELVRRLRKDDEVLPGGAHPSRARVRLGVGLAFGLGARMLLVGGEVVPEVLEVDTLATLHQR